MTPSMISLPIQSTAMGIPGPERPEQHDRQGIAPVSFPDQLE